MATEEKIVNNHSNDELTSIHELWPIFISNWYWFAISITVAIITATLYIMVTPPLYTRTASILIKDNDKSGGSEGISDLQNLGIFKNNININNELLTIQSPTLMSEVVKRLKLDDTYVIEDDLRKKELYKDTPILVTLKHSNYSSDFSFKIIIKNNKDIELSDFNDEYPNIIHATIGKSIKTPIGELTLTLTHKYNYKWNNIPIIYSKRNLKATTDSYTKALTTELGNKNATIINLSINNPSIDKAEDILNTLIEVYNEKWIQDKNQIAISTSHFINDRLGIIENELGNVDNNISSYKSANLLPDVQAAANQYITQSAETKKELLNLNGQLSTAQFIRTQLQKNDNKQPLPSNTGINNNNLQNQINEYNTMLLDRNRLLENSSNKNPLVQDLNTSLQSVQSSIIQSIDNVITSINMQIQNLQSQESKTVGLLASNPEQAKHLLSVERQQKVKEELYLFLLQEREKNELSQAFTAYNTRVITAPRGSSFPTSPKKRYIYMIAFAIGILFPFSVIIINDKMNTKVRGKKDLNNLSIPYLGEIPLTNEEREAQRRNLFKCIRKKSRKNDSYSIVVKEKNRNIINEAFRVVRTNLEFMAATGTNKVIMLTSANPSSGKTFITVNLAVSLAIKDKHILIIDLDLRRASLSNYAHSSKIGIANYLSNQCQVDEIITTASTNSNLDIISVGTIPPNPTELLFNKRLEELIINMRNKYDYIFIDCPPINIVADTSIINKLTDMTIFVVRAGLMERDMLPDIEQLYKDKKFRNMALLLNGTESTYHGKYGYYKYGNYRYGNYYGYYGNKE